LKTNCGYCADMVNNEMVKQKQDIIKSYVIYALIAMYVSDYIIRKYLTANYYFLALINTFIITSFIVIYLVLYEDFDYLKFFYLIIGMAVAIYFMMFLLLQITSKYCNIRKKGLFLKSIVFISILTYLMVSRTHVIEKSIFILIVLSTLQYMFS